MTTRVGQVLRIDRVNSRCEVVCAPGSAIYTCRYPQGYPPPPLAQVAIRSTGPMWTVDDVLSDRLVILHDDFLTVDPVNGYGDTAWTVRNIGGGGGAVFQGTDNTDARGIVSISSGNIANSLEELYKGTFGMGVPSGPTAYWLSFRIKAITLTAEAIEAGFIDGSGVVGAWYRWDVSTARFRVQNGGAAVDVVVPNETAGQWQVIDLVIDEQNLYGWVDGDGPWVTDGGSPSIAGATGFEVRFGIRTTAAAFKSFMVDWAHVEAFASHGRPDLAVTYAGQESV